jgi:hypothetical protein
MKCLTYMYTFIYTNKPTNTSTCVYEYKIYELLIPAAKASSLANIIERKYDFSASVRSLGLIPVQYKFHINFIQSSKARFFMIVKILMHSWTIIKRQSYQD